MTAERGYRTRRRSGIGRIIAFLLVIWLIIGAIAAGQRHYYTKRATTCAHFSTLVVTILAGPLNYMGVNPKSKCPDVKAPQPSK
jgi:riboflavin transporter FmnP